MASTLVDQYHYIETEHDNLTADLKTDEGVKVLTDSELQQYSSKLVASAFRQHIEQADHAEFDEFGNEDSFFVADLGLVYRQYMRWQASLPRVEPMYALKCNGDARVVQMFAKLGMGFDCASMQEIQTVLEMGVDPAKVIYANPCKTPSYLRYSQRVGVDTMTFDNADELRKCKKWYPNAKLLLRIMTDDSTALCQLSVKFGASMQDSFKLLDLAHELDLDVVGVAFHVGSGATDNSTFVQAVANSRELFSYSAKLGHEMSVLDVGGGFENDTFESAAQVLNKALDDYGFAKGVRLIAEPGRFFVASAFSLATHVIGRRWVDKDQGKAMIYVNDGVYANLNCIMFDHQQPVPRVLRVLSNDDEQQFLHGSEINCHGKYEMSVWGPTCDGLDCITNSAQLPLPVDVGDWLYFDNVGAYTLCAASQFNGFNNDCKVLYVCSDSRADRLLA